MAPKIFARGTTAARGTAFPRGSGRVRGLPAHHELRGHTLSDSLAILHARSGYSLARGTIRPEALVTRVAELGYRRVALTDVNGLYGATVFWKAAVAAGLEPLLGVELVEEGRSVVALIDADTGYENLCRIVTRLHARRPVAPCPQVDPPEHADVREAGDADLPADLAAMGDGLQLIVESDDVAAGLLRAGVDGERLWLGVDPPTQSAGRVYRLRTLAEAEGLPLVATGRALLGCADDVDAARVLAAIRTRRTFDSVDAADLPHPRAVLRSPETVRSGLVGLSAAAVNNRRLAERCAGFRLLPRRPVFPHYECPRDLSAEAYLRRLCEAGVSRRYADRPPAGLAARLDRELELIARKGFCEYFLVVREIADYARSRDAPVAGRGSGGSSLAAYLLGITNVCPLTYDIPFERFLNERREDFPDLDLDFCWRIRDDVIDFAFRRWGGDRVAMVSTHNTFQPASAVRETAKAFGLSDGQISRLGGGDFRGPDAPAPMRRITSLARRLIGLPHLLSVHPGGVVIGRKPVGRYVPVQRAAKGVLITQYDKDGVEDIRLVKLDLLGNRNLSTVRYACELIRRRTGRRVDPERLSPDDPETFDRIRAGRTVGCNQLESPAMRHLLRALRPRHLRDVMQALALVRPGAASIGMKDTFIRRRRGIEPVPPGDSRVDPILAATEGVMIHEDDVMLVAAALIGSSLADGDWFRKAVQQCTDDRERTELSRRFLDRCRDNGVDADFARDLWTQMAKFNAYSFCRAHAAGYAVLAYAGAWLRTHYPLEFWTAALNNNQSMYHPRVYVEEAKRCGVRFLLPDVNRSGEEFAIDDGAIRVGLDRVDGLGPVGVKTILDARRRRSFGSLSEFVARTGLGENEVRSLILCGAGDGLGRRRPALMAELNLARAPAPAAMGDGAPLLAVAPTIPDVGTDYSPARKYADERRVLGVNVREHVMALLTALITNKERYGYMACPCRLAAGDREHDRDIICPCIYREPDVKEYGSCYCNLYVSQEWNEGKIPRAYVPERRPPDKIV